MYFAQYLIPYIQTPLFVVQVTPNHPPTHIPPSQPLAHTCFFPNTQSKYDFWQMDNNIYCEMFNIDGVR